MTFLLGLACIVLLTVVVVQIGKVTELANGLRGEEEMQFKTNRRSGMIGMAFLIAFLVFCIATAIYYKNYMLGYGPHESASVHGSSLDRLFAVTLFFTGIVFVLTHILLFWFAYKYHGRAGRKALFLSHDNRLEIIWTIIPAVVMTFLVISGLDAWNDVMADIEEGEDYTEIEATGYQFAWHLRYPGPDGKLGARDYKKINGLNPLGQDWNDVRNLDDIHPSEIVLPVGKKVRVRITARDVLHNFDMPHFRVKMDAVPGMPTYFIFEPQITSEEYRQRLKEYPEYQLPSDPNDPKSDPLWKTFEFELACAELCGSGHYSMRRVVRIVSQEEYDAWLAQQQSYYMSSIRNSSDDPFKGQLLDMEVSMRKQEFDDKLTSARAAETAADRIVRLDYVFFETGSANLTDLSRYELQNVAEAMNKYPEMTIEVAGHTDATGDAAANQSLSEMRSMAVYNYLVNELNVDGSRLAAAGYGSSRPIDSNDTDAGRAKNRRTELQILSL
ncbi:MAG: OmpA family protein [Saprospiraceae bacterium]|nr:OmpA family protein [Saprospiraceae bacterium]